LSGVADLFRSLGAGMSNGGTEGTGAGRSSGASDEAALKAQLRRLGDRVGEMQTARDIARPERTRPSGDAAGLARAFRLSTEFIAGIVAGGLLGYALDRWFNIAPWGLIVCLMLGFGAGLTNVMRAAGMTGVRNADAAGQPGNPDRPEADRNKQAGNG
jgi:ATP synthase protein I